MIASAPSSRGDRPGVPAAEREARWPLGAAAPGGAPRRSRPSPQRARSGHPSPLCAWKSKMVVREQCRWRGGWGAGEGRRKLRPARARSRSAAWGHHGQVDRLAGPEIATEKRPGLLRLDKAIIPGTGKPAPHRSLENEHEAEDQGEEDGGARQAAADRCTCVGWVLRVEMGGEPQKTRRT